MSSKAGTSRHVWHGVLFLVAGVFIFGSYMSIGEPIEQSFLSWGPIAAIGLIGVGIYFLWRGEGFFQKESLALEYYEAVVMAVGIALLVRTFIIEPFKIPSGSMIPTLVVGDYLFVNKFAYGHRIPFTRVRVFMGDGPKRGDIAVFEYPKDPSKDYIKRIVGLPGDHIVYQDKHLFINGKPVGYEDGGTFTYSNERGRDIEARRITELLGDTPHPVLVQPFSYSEQVTDEIVPPGHYFAMGDNRDNSNDSRFWGFVPGYRLVGKAVVIFWSWDLQTTSLRWDRLGSPVK